MKALMPYTHPMPFSAGLACSWRQNIGGQARSESLVDTPASGRCDEGDR